ncbi:aspartic peptidase domain-containing protein [Helicostylum pulchrum]|nr:aspartic peptidase domain-containing protein [Helicostylum pulchrum]
MHFNTLLLVISASSVLSFPTKPQPIHLPLQFIKSKRLTKRDIVVPLIEDVDLSELAVKVQIGTPAQEFLLLFDTGSADTWIASSECSPSNGCPAFLNHFNTSTSSTYEALQDEFLITYGIGSASGHYFKDTMSFVINDQEKITVNQQTLATVNNAVGPISDQNQETDVDHIILDGILGAGLPSGTVRYLQDKGPKYDPFPISLYKAGLIPNPVFSISMNQDKGKLILGGIDTEGISEKFVYTDLVNSSSGPSRWSINVEGLQFHNHKAVDKSRNFKFNQGTPFGIDTGSNFMYLPRALANDLAMSITSNGTFALNEDGVFTIDCQFQSSLDSVNIYFKSSIDHNNTNINIPVSQLISKRDSDGQCLFLFIPSDDKFILGNMILRQFVTVFDFGDIPRIGFAPSKFPPLLITGD